jgi:hypothetical protein
MANDKTSECCDAENDAYRSLGILANGIKSECCGAKIYASLGDGVLIGSCAACDKIVCRMNPRTGRSEWLDGESPWTSRDDLRGMP